MAARAYWQGQIRLALVSTPVRADAPQPAGGNMIGLTAALRKSVGSDQPRPRPAARRKNRSA